MDKTDNTRSSAKSNRSVVPEIERYRLYEMLKRIVIKRNPSPGEYERRVKQIADALGV